MQLARLVIAALIVLCGVWYLLLASSLSKWMPLPLPLQQQTRANAESTSLSPACPTTGVSNQNNGNQNNILHTQTQTQTHTNPSQPTLLPGELPGYTGWARPDRTLAGSFARITPTTTTTRATVTTATSETTAADTDSTIPVVVAGAPYRMTLHCAHPACLSGGALFYVRAYGPSIVTAFHVEDYGTGVYEISIRPLDEGSYTVEVVLAFSQHAAYSDFPVPDAQEVAYEGYLVPGFPISIDVVGNSKHKHKSTSLPLCRLSDLVETSLTSATETGRWLVTDKVMDHLADYSRESEHTDVSLQKYQAGDNSVGVTLDYFPVECRLVTEDVVYGQETWQTCLESRSQKASSSSSKSRQPHVVIIGDSNFRLQKEVFAKFFGGALPVTYLKTQNGIVARLPEVKVALKELAQDAADKDYYVLFNTGLHDIISLCTREYPYWKTPSTSATATDASVAAAEKCGVVYRRALVDFVQTVQAFPNVLAVWQTTTAGWPKWGMYAASWPGDVKQKLPLAPNFVEYFNEIAWDVMQEFNVSVQDAYWLTLSRPDHRDAREKNALGKRLVHAGPQVYSVTMRKWAMMILETTCPDMKY
jgi:hypothetical protein